MRLPEQNGDQSLANDLHGCWHVSGFLFFFGAGGCKQHKLLATIRAGKLLMLPFDYHPSQYRTCPPIPAPPHVLDKSAQSVPPQKEKGGTCQNTPQNAAKRPSQSEKRPNKPASKANLRTKPNNHAQKPDWQTTFTKPSQTARSQKKTSQPKEKLELPKKPKSQKRHHSNPRNKKPQESLRPTTNCPSLTPTTTTPLQKKGNHPLGRTLEPPSRAA